MPLDERTNGHFEIGRRARSGPPRPLARRSLLLVGAIALAASLPAASPTRSAAAPLPANPAAQRAEMIRLLRSIDERLSRLVELAERGGGEERAESGR